MNTQRTLALLAPLALVAVMFALLFVEIPPNARDIFNIALGALITLAKDVYGFWFGSSKGSRGKDAVMRDMKNVG